MKKLLAAFLSLALTLGGCAGSYAADTTAANAPPAGSVVTNANLTGPITSSGNATTIGSLITAIKIGTFTRVMNAVSGNVAYTGVGFRPSFIRFDCGFATSGWNAMSWGSDDGTNRKAIAYWAVTSGNELVTVKSIVLYDATGATFQSAQVASFDADGFTLTWALTGAGNAASSYCVYTAFK